jgi:4-diphosphocytidyl-2-C-methyl-D-erythritol kinase
VKIRAPAKLNLSLRIVGKRKDGYHLLDTIMVPITLFDELEIKRRVGKKETSKRALPLRVTCDHPLVPGGEKNLVHRAASLLLQTAGIQPAIDIHIRKRIPVGAGLGGGSTDAAAALVGLNRLLKLGYSVAFLEKLAASIGADVPFFVRSRPAQARGVGDRLTPLTHIDPWWVVVLYPKFAVSTAWVYSNLSFNLTKSRPNTTVSTLLTRRQEYAGLFVNDLEAVTVRRYPQIRLMKDSLIELGALGASMTGSGSAVFGAFGSREKAKNAFRRLRKINYSQAFLAQVVSRPRRLTWVGAARALKRGGPYGSHGN